jgi:hypothetical protein
MPNPNVEPNADIHAPQADGDSESLASPVENPVDDTVIDGRITGVPPNYEEADLESNPSARDAAEQDAKQGQS